MHKIIYDRGIEIVSNQKDDYITQVRKLYRTDKSKLLLDKLLIVSIIEASGHERFSLVAQAKDKDSYHTIAKSEEKHKGLFVDLAY